MPLTELLRDLVYDCGALGALVMDADGFPLEEFRSDDLFDLQMYAEEFASLLSHAHHVTTHLESGVMAELTLQTDRLRIIIRALSDGAALLLALPVDGSCGRARYLLRRDWHRFLEALPGEA